MGFREVLNSHSPEAPLSQADTVDALRNLTGFIETLIRINERTKLVPDVPPTRSHLGTKRNGHAGK